MMNTVISARELGRQVRSDWVLVDCRFDLADPSLGERQYRAGHLPNAHYLHLDYHLSGPKNGQNGRHPLPDPQRLAVDLGTLGIGPETQVVSYDDSGGMFAARAWWLLRWLGHEAVAVLDGGWQAWRGLGEEIDVRPSPRHTQRFTMRPALVSCVTVDTIENNLASRQFTVVDARAEDRFHGQNETLDPIGGHIPGAVNRFFRLNLDSDGCFKSPPELRAEWLRVLDSETSAQNVIHQCGSGVTACVNLLAMERAGLQGSRLYPGSWSEWCADPARPVATV